MDALSFIVAALAVLQNDKLGSSAAPLSMALILAALLLAIYKWALPSRWFRRLAVGPQFDFQLEHRDISSDDGNIAGLVLNVHNKGPACRVGGYVRIFPSSSWFSRGGVNGHRRPLMWEKSGKDIQMFEGERVYIVLALANLDERIIRVVYRDEAMTMDSVQATFAQMTSIVLEIELYRDPGFPAPVRFTIDVSPTLTDGSFHFNGRSTAIKPG